MEEQMWSAVSDSAHGGELSAVEQCSHQGGLLILMGTSIWLNPPIKTESTVDGVFEQLSGWSLPPSVKRSRLLVKSSDYPENCPITLLTSRWFTCSSVDGSEEDQGGESEHHDSIFSRLEELRFNLEQQMGFEKFIEAYNKIKVWIIHDLAVTCWSDAMWLSFFSLRLFTRTRMKILSWAPVWFWASSEPSTSICTPTSSTWWWQMVHTKKVSVRLLQVLILVWFEV